ncbi:MAG: hypothetical protein ACREVW_08410 [Burkholderiales bacterium]
METESRGQRIIRALQQLEQFKPGHNTGLDYAENVLTGARVEPLPDPDDQEHGALTVSFPGGRPMTVNGDLYLDLQVIESVRFENDSAEESSKVARRVADLSQHFARKYDLN